MTLHILGLPSEDDIVWACLALACSLNDPFYQNHTPEEILSALVGIADAAGTLVDDE